MNKELLREDMRRNPGLFMKFFEEKEKEFPNMKQEEQNDYVEQFLIFEEVLLEEKIISERTPNSLYLQKILESRKAAKQLTEQEWLGSFFGSIEGKNGPVKWS